MKKLDLVAVLGFILLILFFIFDTTRDMFNTFTTNYPILAGFTKFFILATFGDILSSRIKNKKWVKPTGLFYKAIVWGIIGIFIVLAFNIFTNGIAYLQSINLLPFDGSKLAFAFFTSLFMNIIFAPTMMSFHRIFDTIIEDKVTKEYTNFKDTVAKINWPGFYSFVVLKTIPLFWIPAHTITFLLPKNYQVLFAAILGIALGLILGLFNNKK